MPVEMLTYAELGERLKISAECSACPCEKAAIAPFPIQRWQNTSTSRFCRDQPLPGVSRAAKTGRSPGGHHPKPED